MNLERRIFKECKIKRGKPEKEDEKCHFHILLLVE